MTLGLVSLGLFLLGGILLAIKAEPLLSVFQMDEVEDLLEMLFSILPAALVVVFLIGVAMQVLMVPAVAICSIRPYRALLILTSLFCMGSAILQVVQSIMAQSLVNSYSSQYLSVSVSSGIGGNFLGVLLMIALGLLMLLTVTGVISITIPVVAVAGAMAILLLVDFIQAFQAFSLVNGTYGMFGGYYAEGYEEMDLILAVFKDVLLILAGLVMQYVTLLVIFLNLANPSVVRGRGLGLLPRKMQQGC